MKLGELLRRMVEEDASDLHLKAGSPPGLRVHGKLKPVEGAPPLGARDCNELIAELLDEELNEAFEENKDMDFSKHLEGLARFRVNLFHQRGSRAAVLRRIPIETPVLEDMKFPDVVRALCHKPRGLCLVTGPTGSGKSTTLAAMIDYINRQEYGHILTLEDPIEFIHNDKNCFVNQREIGSDSRSFSNALRAALREDPDHILVGEMRDLETISLAITAAETGHMVFGTLHTTSAIQTVDRIIDVFPYESQQQVRTQLSVTLQGVISQTLLPKIGGGRVCAQEIMVGTDAVRSCVREGKTPQLINVLQTGMQYGMQTLESHMAQLVLEGLVRPEDAVAKANNASTLLNILDKAGVTVAVGQPIHAGGAAPGPARPHPSGPQAAPRSGERSTAPVSPAAPTPRSTNPDDEFERFRAQRRR